MHHFRYSKRKCYVSHFFSGLCLSTTVTALFSLPHSEPIALDRLIDPSTRRTFKKQKYSIPTWLSSPQLPPSILFHAPSAPIRKRSKRVRYRSFRRTSSLPSIQCLAQFSPSERPRFDARLNLWTSLDVQNFRRNDFQSATKPEFSSPMDVDTSYVIDMACTCFISTRSTP
ncbi:uncharacterized protein LACBIDRAFT_328565 [Laccaria bicolor S238N-H82]|uniref:Predicted protein n=1 Tax=Laccaria bicolor (strain S238N-H82 / ATCC MYA-4686) TaxID=486041 RepID=B0DFA6_LACBS|nr:uncharacterized protein LACBIDRAFT_328565 [Laccaria bicolor S238N-H82]EDR06827.1 predicted protein [Laccaria bicolor S238N-H82]|eukprot:XP_001882674.1 predicted protein [Laccaria bicolor S238N-H82]